MKAELVSESRCFDGWQRTYRHDSTVCGCKMQFATFLPKAAEKSAGYTAVELLGDYLTRDDRCVLPIGSPEPSTMSRRLTE